MKRVAALGVSLEQYLKNLNFENAIVVADELAKLYVHQNVQFLWEKPSIQHVLMIAETLFYRGQSESARKLLSPYVFTIDTIKEWGSETSPKCKDVSQRLIGKFIEKTHGIPMRWKLQVGELFYSLRFLEKAKDFAKTLYEEHHQLGERFEEGEIEFFRARIANREANYEHILKHSMLAIAALTESDTSEDESRLVRWRLGQLLLVFGTGAWRYGDDPNRGIARLHLSRWFIEAIPDKLTSANVQHALGNIFRAQGEFTKAREHLDQAKMLYESLHHTLNCARVHTSLGVYWLNKKSLGYAEREFESAMRLAEKTGSKRQQAEVTVWRSWLAQEEPNPKIQRAISYGGEALALLEAVKEEHYVRVEAHIAVGSAHLANDDLLNAERNVNVALKLATEHKLRKHMVSAHLSMAEILYRQSKTKDAWDHYMTATTKIIPDGKETDSKYLCGKRDRIKTDLEKGNAFYLTLDQLLRHPKSLKKCQEELAAWLIDQTQRHENGNKTKTALLLNIPRQRVSSHMNSRTKGSFKKRSSA